MTLVAFLLVFGGTAIGSFTVGWSVRGLSEAERQRRMCLGALAHARAIVAERIDDLAARHGPAYQPTIAGCRDAATTWDIGRAMRQLEEGGE